MKHLGRVAVAAILLALSSWTMLAAQRASPVPPPLWRDRLESLRPDKPIEYFELAEEIADQAVEPSHRELAKQLFGLAGALEPHRLGRSACLALADLEADDLAKRRYLALAWLLGPQNGYLDPFASLHPSRFGGEQPSTEAIIGLCEAISHYRKGSGSQAQAALRKPGAVELLKQHGAHIPGGADRFLEDLKLYRGATRPALSATDVSRLVRLEAALLAGPQRSWSQEILLNDARPLIEVDPHQLAESLGVDPSAATYRNGRWVAK